MIGDEPMASADTPTLVMAVATTVSAIATIVLAFVTWKLASATKRLVETTRDEGIQNAEANQRSYQLAFHQIDLHSKTLVYNDTLQYIYDDFLLIQGLATTLSLTFKPTAFGQKLALDEKVARGSQIITRISLNGSSMIGIRFVQWMHLMNEVQSNLRPYVATDQFGDSRLADSAPPLGEIQEAFDYLYGRLKTDYEELSQIMRDELHPSALEANPLGTH